MSLQEIVALLRRHIAAVLLVVLVAAGVAYMFKRTPTNYQESATVVFTPPASSAFPNPYVSISYTLVETAGLIAIEVMSPQGLQRVEAAGGSAAYDVQLYNLYNLQFPDFGDPYDTVTVTAADPEQVHRTFGLVTQLIYADLAALQAERSVPALDRIAASAVGDTGPLAQPGSHLRMYIGLFVLMIVSAFSLAVFLDQHPLRIPRGSSSRRLGGGSYSRPLGRPAP